MAERMDPGQRGERRLASVEGHLLRVNWRGNTFQWQNAWTPEAYRLRSLHTRCQNQNNCFVQIPRHASTYQLSPRAPLTATGAWYSDEKVANRDIRIWHLVIENGY
jgi:hypothetical protein